MFKGSNFVIININMHFIRCNQKIDMHFFDIFGLTYFYLKSTNNLFFIIIILFYLRINYYFYSNPFSKNTFLAFLSIEKLIVNNSKFFSIFNLVKSQLEIKNRK